MNNFLPTSPEISTDLANLHIRTDLIQNSVSIYLKDWNLWDVDTLQVKLSENVTHFIQPNEEIVGVKVFSNNDTLSGRDQRCN